MRRLLVLAAGVLALGPPALHAQISPGKLSRAHAALEGSAHCLECHEAGKGVAREKCLACHKAVGERIAAGRGLHARAEYRDCKHCHVDHQGADYDLVWWGKPGPRVFDHRLAGLVLEGKHAGLDCRACHQPRLRQTTLAAATNATRTFLGLGTACAACHKDIHRGPLAGRDCAICHSQQAWRPAPGFDHGKTAYPLIGRHASAACARCHKATPTEAAGPSTTFTVAAYRQCTACHADVHTGRLGADCERCHTTDSWRGRNLARFDHGRTAYALTGRHASVACQKCHVPGRGRRVRHERCADCHSDTHLAQLAQRADQGRCEACHDAVGFSPARFTIEDHQKTGYPLAGAHLAIACIACHRPVARATIEKMPAVHVPQGARLVARTTQLRFASTRCADCHKDPHRGETSHPGPSRGCEGCHAVESWKKIAFDHGQTRYALTGGHVKPACGSCHKKVDAATPRERIPFGGLATACDACHKDPHPGRYVRAATVRPCESCHVTESWQTSRFDHARTRYRLEGAHARVACAACHGRGQGTAAAGGTLPTACKDCHRPAAPARTQERRL